MSPRMDNREKKCPGCSGVLKEVYAEANYGRVLLLDQCARCGSVWFDRWELYFLKESEARRLEGVDVEALRAFNPARRGSGKCPVCDLKLVPFNDPTLPPDASIKRCTGCKGLWLNRGELTRYASHRASLKGVSVDAAGAGADKLEALKNLQKALDTSGVANPQTLELEDLTMEPGEFVKDLAPIILQILFKLVFKF